nr:formin-like protein 8 [Lolium perenne]
MGKKKNNSKAPGRRQAAPRRRSGRIGCRARAGGTCTYQAAAGGSASSGCLSRPCLRASQRGAPRSDAGGGTCLRTSAPISPSHRLRRALEDSGPQPVQPSPPPPPYNPWAAPLSPPVWAAQPPPPVWAAPPPAPPTALAYVLPPLANWLFPILELVVIEDE